MNKGSYIQGESFHAILLCTLRGELLYLPDFSFLNLDSNFDLLVFWHHTFISFHCICTRKVIDDMMKQNEPKLAKNDTKYMVCFLFNCPVLEPIPMGTVVKGSFANDGYYQKNLE